MFQKNASRKTQKSKKRAKNAGKSTTGAPSRHRIAGIGRAGSFTGFFHDRSDEHPKDTSARFGRAVVRVSHAAGRNTGINADRRGNGIDFMRIRVYIIYSMFF